ncbi:P-loop containing nucleoside triphosphate hydrolase protein [Parathielavia appendiculata]|uniref:DNA repair protein RAD51 homolog 3 n=1 Tax=Parathielavia appendiculata TaxID=2587402 RepID=A0AAN6U463_9PEZI|nr:P-loop containing nucleoside triphosphate hydrolase protein [Parathielavia appendiculata]
MMDYHAIHGHDISNLDLPSMHRLPTVSAAQALQELEGSDSNFIATGLPSLDAALGSALEDAAHPTGVQKGHVTEIWGPPGVGKTAFGYAANLRLNTVPLLICFSVQLASNCLGEGRRVVWVDGFHRLPIERLRTVVATGATGDEDAGLDRLDGFTHYTCPSLPHLIALLCRPTAALIPQGAALIVVDSVSALVNHAFPKLPETRPATDAKGSRGPSATARRLQVLQYIVSSLQKLAATRDLAVVILTQCATKMQAERGATLIPALNANVWEQGMSTRLVLFRNWLCTDSELRGLHLVAIQKLNGKGVTHSFNKVYAFRVEKRGLVPVEYDNTQQSTTLTTNPAPKRKLGDTDFEIADSDDESYGWDDDEELPPMPSQWQGSEDLLLVREPGSEDEDKITDDQPLDALGDKGQWPENGEDLTDGESRPGRGPSP